MGRMFNSLDEVSEDAGPVPARIVEQVQISPLLIAYRTWRYVSWNWQLSRIRTLLSPALRLTSGVIFTNSIRLEYLDRFRFEGDTERAMASGVLKDDSTWVAPHIFSRSDLWHSHSGAYLSDDGPTKRIQQVHVETVNEPPIGTPEKRWMNLMTARENRYADDTVEQTSDGIFSTLDTMHADLIGLTKSLVTSEIFQTHLPNGRKVMSSIAIKSGTYTIPTITMPGSDKWTVNRLADEFDALGPVELILTETDFGKPLTGPGRVVPLHSAKERTKARFRMLRRLSENHDGEGAAAPIRQTVDTAIAFVDCLIHHPDFFATLDDEGRAVLEFEDKTRGFFADLAFHEDGTIECYRREINKDSVEFRGNHSSPEARHFLETEMYILF